ncbi:succinate--hydroxymethylglutarate CoA-transferase [Rhypophila sp. PSN 637]
MDQDRLPDVYGPGTFTNSVFSSVPDDSARIFRLLASQTPGFTQDESLLSRVTFVGDSDPIIPGPIKSVPVAAALHGMIGLVAHEILSLRGVPNPRRTTGKSGDPVPSESSASRKVTINTTHAALWLASVSLAYLDGESFSSLARQSRLRSMLPDWERGWQFNAMRLRATGIYPTKTPGRWYSLHGSLDQPPMLKEVLNIDADEPGIDTHADAALYIAASTQLYSPLELEMKSITGGFCGSICFTPQEWRDSAMGKALARHPLVNVVPQSHAVPTPPVPFPAFFPSESAATGGEKETTFPLSGIKVIELTRIIAGPQIGAILSSLGASVIRISAPHLRDINSLQLTLNAGKQTISLDLRESSDRTYLLENLLPQADVFIQGFRPGVLDKYGLGLNHLLKMAGERQKGIIYVTESCYGPDGVYASRPGWQQIADCASGAAHVMGRSLGLEDGECVLPSLPISDMTAGAVGALGALMALRDRTTKGGSSLVHASIVAGNMFALSKEVGLYSREVVAKCTQRFRWGEMRGQHHVLDLLRTVLAAWDRDDDVRELLREDIGDEGLFTTWEESAFGGRRLSVLKPVVRFRVDGEGEAELGVGPEWKTPSVPHGWSTKHDVTF